jgi:hypothetical protein
MDIRTPHPAQSNPASLKKRTSTPKTPEGNPRKSARLRGFSPISLGQCWPGHWPGQPGPKLAQPGPTSRPAPGLPRASSLSPAGAPLPAELGEPLGIREVAALIGCSPWTVRQTLVPRGFPFFRSGASGRLIFYRDQVIRWIENQQGGKTTK